MKIFIPHLKQTSLEMYQTVDFIILEFVPAIKKIQLHYKSAGFDACPGLFDQLTTGFCRSACRKQIVNQQHPIIGIKISPWML